MKLIIARHVENVEWTDRYDAFIVQKGEHLPNRGREPSSYLWYILEHWDKLKGHYMFLQGYPFDHCSDIDGQIEEIPFKWLGNHSHTCDMRASPQDNIDLKKFIKEAQIERMVDQITFLAGCQFIVSAEQIKKRPREFYENLLKLMDNEEERYPWAFERCVELIFGDK